jgi:uncharacterized protein YukE
MADREFKIRITTEADTAAARGTSDALQNLGQTGTKAQESIAEATGKTEISHRALRVALSQLGPEFAHLGHSALYAFANPATAAVIGLALVVGALKRHFDDLAKSAEEAAKRTNDALDNIKTSTSNANEEIGKADRSFADWFKHINSETGTVIKNLDSVLEKIKAINGQSEEGQKQSKEAVEKAIGEVAGLLPGADAAAILAEGAAKDQTRAAKIKALPGMISAGRSLSADLLKAAEPTALDKFREFTGFQPAFLAERQAEMEDQKAQADKQRRDADANEAELKRLKIEQEQKDKEANDAKQKKADLEAQLTELSARQESLTGGGASRTATPGLAAGVSPFFHEAMMGFTAKSRQQGPTESQHTAMIQFELGMRARTGSDEAFRRISEMLANSQVSEKQKNEAVRHAIEQKLKSLANKAT